MTVRERDAAPSVSIVVPAYNHQRYIGEAIQSCLEQSFRDFELIIVDDCSVDDTWARIRSYEDPRIHAYRNEHNRGAHATINLGIEKSRGEYIQILNSDDRFHPERLQRLLDLAQQHPVDELFIFTDAKFIHDSGDEDRARERYADYQRLSEYCRRIDADYWFLAGNPAIGTSNFFFSRSLYQHTGPFHELRYTHDWDWVVRSLDFTQPRWLDEPLLEYRVHGSNTLSEGDAWRHIHENSYIQSLVLQRLLGVTPKDADDASRSLACTTLLHNDSFHPLSLLFFLSQRLQGRSHSELLRFCSTTSDEKWWLAQVAEESSTNPAMFRSLAFLSEMLDRVDNQTLLLKERWEAMQNMERLIVERNEQIESNRALLAERMSAINNMNAVIRERKTIMDNMERVLKERKNAMNNMERVLKERKTTMDNMERVLKERKTTMNNMERVLKERKQTMDNMEQRFIELKQRYDRLASSHVVRLARWLGKFRPGKR